MRVITSLLGLSTLGLLALSAALYRQLTASRESEAHAVATVAELREEIERLKDTRAGLWTDLRAARDAPPAPQLPAAGIASAQTPVRGVLLGSASGNVPEMTDEQRRWLTRRRYQAAFRELGMSDSEIAAALPVLLQQDLRTNKPLPRDGAAPEQDPQRDEAELAAVIGHDKAAHFTEFRKTQPARTDLKLLRSRLEDSDEPLSSQQQEALLKILTSRAAQEAPRRTEGEDPKLAMERLNSWWSERDQRLRQDAAPVLTPTQQKLLDEDSAFQASMRARMVPPPSSMAATAAAQAGSSAPR